VECAGGWGAVYHRRRWVGRWLYAYLLAASGLYTDTRYKGMRYVLSCVSYMRFMFSYLSCKTTSQFDLKEDKQVEKTSIGLYFAKNVCTPYVQADSTIDC